MVYLRTHFNVALSSFVMPWCCK